MSDNDFQLCRNGPACFFLARGGCWFLHPSQEERARLEAERERMKELNSLRAEHYSLRAEINRLDEARRYFLRRPLHTTRACFHTIPLTEEDEVMWRINQLPSELKVLILQQLGLELLLGLEMAPRLLREVLRVPREQGLDSWLGRTLARRGLGLIHVTAKNSLSLTVQGDFEEESRNSDDEDTEKHLTMSSMPPGLEPGTYKLRIIHEGFDLVLVSRHFLSSGCGPLACFPRAQHGPWSGSFLSRGFSLHTKDRSDLAPGGLVPCKDTWPLALDLGSGDPLARPAFVISLEEDWWLRPWRHVRARSYSMDEVATREVRELAETVLGLGVVTSVPDGQVVAYTVSGGDCLSAYDPDGYPNSDEGAYYVSDTRYSYKDQESRIGLIITGSQNYYDMARDWTQDEPAPDQEHYTNPASPRQ